MRCVKPNATKEPGKLDSKLVLDQLRYLGILETVRLRQRGFALRLTLREFIVRYKCLQPSVSMAPANERASVLILLAIAGPAETDVRLGKNKIFLRTPAEALLERAVRAPRLYRRPSATRPPARAHPTRPPNPRITQRTDRISDYTALLKRAMHVWLNRRRFKKALDLQRGSAQTIQKTARMFLAKRSMQAVKDAFALVCHRNHVFACARRVSNG